MIVKNNRNNQIELAFGNGDICIAGGYVRDCLLQKSGLVTFINQEPRAIGAEGITKGGEVHLLGELPIIMTFTNEASVDEVIGQLQQAKEEMRVITQKQGDKNWLDLLVEDKGKRYQVIVDNDSAWVEDKERDFQPVYNFEEFGYELALVLLQYMGIKAKMC